MLLEHEGRQEDTNFDSTSSDAVRILCPSIGFGVTHIAFLWSMFSRLLLPYTLGQLLLKLTSLCPAPGSRKPTGCENRANWRDNVSDHCGNYISCKDGGWVSKGDDYYDTMAVNGVSARDACCDCGGGSTGRKSSVPLWSGSPYLWCRIPTRRASFDF